jgi:general secretion pathway protein I
MMRHRTNSWRAPAHAGAHGHKRCTPDSGLLRAQEHKGVFWPDCAKLRSAEHGFTLIEMMVALAVFSLAALALIRLEGATIRGASILDATLTAQIVARNVAIEAVTDARPPVIGDTTGTESNGGRAWQWTRHVEPTGDTRIMRIDVTVTDAAGARQGHITMVRATVPEPAPTPTRAAS